MLIIFLLGRFLFLFIIALGLLIWLNLFLIIKIILIFMIKL